MPETSSEPTTGRVYLSYPSSRRDLADFVAKQLRESGVDIGMLDEEASPGEDVRDRIKESLLHSQAMIILITPESLKSDWIAYELGFAGGLERQVIPIVVDVMPEDLPPQLANVQNLRLNDLHRLRSVLNNYIDPPNAFSAGQP